mgnify:CR=1 FL=1
MKKQSKSKPAQQTTPTPEYDSQRETRVLLDEVNHNVKMVSEQHGSIVKKLEEHDRRFDRMESELNSVKMVVMDSGHQIKALRDGQQEIKQKLDTVVSQNEERFKRIEEKIEIA